MNVDADHVTKPIMAKLLVLILLDQLTPVHPSTTRAGPYLQSTLRSNAALTARASHPVAPSRRTTSAPSVPGRKSHVALLYNGH